MDPPSTHTACFEKCSGLVGSNFIFGFVSVNVAGFRAVQSVGPCPRQYGSLFFASPMSLWHALQSKPVLRAWFVPKSGLRCASSAEGVLLYWAG